MKNKMKNIQLISYLWIRGQEVQETIRNFKNLSDLKKYIKQCGGMKDIKWEEKDSFCRVYIKGSCNKCDECYYEYKFGKYRWMDCNGYCID